MFAVDKLRVVISGEIIIFEDKMDNVKSIDLDIENGIIKVEYEPTSEWRYSIIPINQTEKIDYNVLPEDIATIIKHSIQEER